MCAVDFGHRYEKYYPCSLRLHLYPHVAELVVSWKEVIVVTMALGRSRRRICSVRIGWGFSVSLIQQDMRLESV